MHFHFYNLIQIYDLYKLHLSISQCLLSMAIYEHIMNRYSSIHLLIIEFLLGGFMFSYLTFFIWKLTRISFSTCFNGSSFAMLLTVNLDHLNVSFSKISVLCFLCYNQVPLHLNDPSPQYLLIRQMHISFSVVALLYLPYGVASDWFFCYLLEKKTIILTFFSWIFLRV